MSAVEPPHPNDDIEDWPEIVQWLRDNWEAIPFGERFELKRMLSRIAEINALERIATHEAEAAHKANLGQIKASFEAQREKARQKFRKAVDMEDTTP